MLENQLIGQDKYIKVLPNVRKYLVEDFENFDKTYVFGAETSREVIQWVISKDNYSFEEYEGANYLRFAEGFPIENYDRIKILKAEDVSSIPVEFTTVSTITPEALNRNFDALGGIVGVIQNIINERALRIDAYNGEILLPKLQEGEVWVKSAEGYRAMNITELEEKLRQLQEEIVVLGINTLEAIKNAETPKIAEAEKKALNDFTEASEKIVSEGINCISEEIDRAKASIEEYLITAESGGNAEFVQGYSPSNFNRVEATISALVISAGNKYKVGDVVEVLGYYKAGDGGHHKRKIASADDGSGVRLTNGLWANVVKSNEIESIKADISTSRTEPIPGSRIPDGDIPARKLKTSTDADRIQPYHLSDAVKSMMTGDTPVSPAIGNNEITREKIADGAVNVSKVNFLGNVSNYIGMWEWEQGWVQDDGTIGKTEPNYSLYKTTDYIPVMEGEEVSGFTIPGYSLGLLSWYDQNYNHIERVPSDNPSKTIVVPTGACYARVSYNTTISQTYFYKGTDEGYKSPLIELGEKIKIKKEDLDFTALEKSDFSNYETVRKTEYENIINKNDNRRSFDCHVGSDGILVGNQNFDTTDFIKIKPNTRYSGTTTQLDKLGLFCFYDWDRKPIIGYGSTGVPDGNSIISPSNAEYVRVSTPKKVLNFDSVFYEGDYIEGYTPIYKQDVTGIDGDRIEFKELIIKSKNIINPYSEDIVADHYMSGDMPKPLHGYKATGFIAIEPDTVYSGATSHTGVIGNICFYDRFKKRIVSYDSTGAPNAESGLAESLINKVTTPTNACYVRATIPPSGLSSLYLGTEYKGYVPYQVEIPGLKLDLPSTISSDLSEDDILVQVRASYMDFYIKGSKTDSNKYMKYRFEYSQKPYSQDESNSPIGQNYTVIRMEGGHIVERNANGSFTTLFTHINVGEWETAIKQADKTDFVGGIAHGDEQLEYYTLLVDGKIVNLGEAQDLVCKNIKLALKSKLYYVGSTENIDENNFANKFMEWDITVKGGMILTQRIEFLRDFTCGVGTYVSGMLPIRIFKNGEGTENVTDRYYFDRDYTVQDISLSTHPSPRFYPSVKKVVIWGETSGVSASMEFLQQEPYLEGSFTFIQNGSVYNKVYNSFTGNNHKCVAGDVWKTKTRYKIDVNN